jgi:hypothetical protein
MFEPCIRLKKIMGKYGFPWFVAGGWAIDLFIGKEMRVHEDIEIGIFRKDQMKLYKYLEKYKKYYIDNKSRIGKLEKHDWNKEYLRLPIHELYVQYDDLEIEILLNEREEPNWVYRRNEKIRLVEEKAILHSEEGIPYLCPEIVLLYKTKDMREKDIADLKNAFGKMSEYQKKWLMDSIGNKEIVERIRNLTTCSS